MREFNLDLLIGKKVVVNCKTEDESDEFLKYLNSKDIKWNCGSNIIENEQYEYNDYGIFTCFCLEYLGNLQYSPIDYYEKEGYKILSLDDITIFKVKNPLYIPKNNFKEYGFEADFEGEICFQDDDFNRFFGFIVKDGKKLARSWNKYGVSGMSYEYDLTPIKKEWYENPDNFSVVMIDIETKKPHIAYAYKDGRFQTENFTVKFNKYRPATKEEISSLMMKI